MTVTNALAYYDKEFIRAVKSFMVHALKDVGTAIVSRTKVKKSHYLSKF